jgi:two-component system, sensor histidine kinase PdtaS
MSWGRLVVSNPMSAHEIVIQFPKSYPVPCDTCGDERPDAMTARLQATLAREERLRKEIGELLRRQSTLALEFERRLLNGLEVIARLLSSQSQTATTPEAASQLSVVACGIAAIGRWQCRINNCDR